MSYASLQRAFVLGHRGRRAAGIAGGEEQRLDQGEVALRPACGPSAPSRPCRASRRVLPSAIVSFAPFAVVNTGFQRCPGSFAGVQESRATRTGAGLALGRGFRGRCAAHDRIAHLARADLACVPSTQMSAVRQTRLQHLSAPRRLDPVGSLGLIEREAEHHGSGQDCSQRIGDSLAGDVRRAAVAGLVRGLVVRAFERGRQAACRSEPVSIAASSDRMSPNMLPVTITSNFFGAAAPAASPRCPRTCGRARRPGICAATSVTTSFQNWKVSSTLALSTLVTACCACAPPRTRRGRCARSPAGV